MDQQIEKIQTYLDEVRRTWEKNPEFVLSRQFFELWEATQQPEPFIANDSIDFNEQSLQAPGRDSVGVFCWEHAEEVPCLHVEDDALEMRYPLFVTDGSPEFGDPALLSLDDSGVSFGERLEFILDVIAKVRQRHPSRNVLEMQKRDYLEAISELSDSYEDRTYRLMNRLKLPEIRTLVTKAVQDMAQDELSDQLVLPLDGSYAAEVQTAPTFASSDAFESHPSPSKTRHTILRNLKFISNARRLLSRIQEETILPFRNVTIIETKPKMIVKLQTPHEASFRKGDKLSLMVRDDHTPVGQFRVVLNDRNSLIGEIRWPHAPEELTPDHYLKPVRSPDKYLAEIMDAFVAEFKNGGRFESNSLNAALGVDDYAYEDAAITCDDDSLDSSQIRAWANAVNPNNPLTLIQGPPGTGKTHVLVSVIRSLVNDGKRILVAAPSHTAVDNICKRILDLPLLRLGRDPDKIDVVVRETCWIGDIAAVHGFQTKREGGASIYAGTHVGLMSNDILRTDLDKNGLFDVVIFDEAGMAKIDEFLICMRLSHRAILFGDHQQLPPFPLPDSVLTALRKETPFLHEMRNLLTQSPLQWLVEERQIPVFVLQSSYRCQNPKLMRFSSMMFYNAQVKTSALADYYHLPFDERQERYPSSSLRFMSTSDQPIGIRGETLVYSRNPGFENAFEAKLAIDAVYQYLERYPLNEITIIAPYRCQIELIRGSLDRDKAEKAAGAPIEESDWTTYLNDRISTVDSFQGGESDVVIICYVRSNAAGGIGFVDDPNRINVAHTRCRREMLIIGDLTCLKRKGRNRIFHRMERAIVRDGEIIEAIP